MSTAANTQPVLSPAHQRVYWGALRRLKRIREELLAGPRNRRQLAVALNSKVRTVQRDLDFLRDQLDAPIHYDRCQRGYTLTNRNWRLPDILLTEGELISFFVAEQLLRQLGDASPEVQLARAAVTRLAALLPDQVVVDLEALSSAVSFAPAPALAASPNTLRRLTEAATKHETLRINYFSQNSQTQRERAINVLGLHQALGEWYVIAEDCEDAQQRKIFHAGRIGSLQPTGSHFTPPADWAAQRQAYLKQGFGMFLGGAAVTVIVEFDADQARYARERTYHATQKPDELPDGGLRLTFETTEAALEQVARWVMQYGVHVVVVEPARLREMVREKLRQTLGLYSNNEDYR